MIWPFKKVKKSEPKVPRVGENWVLKRRAKGPWPASGDLITAHILDVKDDWVRYFLNRIFPDLRMKTKDFVEIYDPLD